MQPAAAHKHIITNQPQFDAHYIALGEIAERAGVTRQGALAWIGSTLPHPFARAGKTLLWERSALTGVLEVLEEQKRQREKLRALVAA